MNIKPFFHQQTKTFSYVVSHQHQALIIDPVLDFNVATLTVSGEALKEIIQYLKDNHLSAQAVLDTHLHADHMSGAYYLKQKLEVPSAIGRNFLASQQYFAATYEITPTPNAYDRLLTEGQHTFGAIDLTTIFTPGHTASCSSYLVKDALFCGDTLFRPELGCGRADFPGGSAVDLYHSITEKIFSLPESTKIFVGHDYPTTGEPKPETSVALAKEQNILIKKTTLEKDFVSTRKARDQSLTPPALMPYVVQVNINGGLVPKKFLKLPISFDKNFLF